MQCISKLTNVILLKKFFIFMYAVLFLNGMILLNISLLGIRRHWIRSKIKENWIWIFHDHLCKHQKKYYKCYKLWYNCAVTYSHYYSCDCQTSNKNSLLNKHDCCLYFIINNSLSAYCVIMMLRLSNNNDRLSRNQFQLQRLIAQLIPMAQTVTQLISMI